MPRCLAQPRLHPLYSLPALAALYQFVLGSLEPTFENGRGVELYDAVVSHAAVSDTAVPALPLRSPCTRCCVRIMPSRDYVRIGSRGGVV